MIPQRLVLKDFRNIQQADIEFAPRLTFLLGNNAQGKTNTLEALAYALTLRPLRRSRLSDLIRQNQHSARIDVTLSGPTLPWKIKVQLEPNSRRIEVNGKQLRDPANLLGAVALVAFTPDDLALVKGAPELRRKSLDRFVFQIQPSHLRHVRDYQRALRSRNLLLKHGEADASTMAAFTQTMAQSGAKVMLGRRMAVELLQPAIARRHSELAPGGGELRLLYQPDIPLSAQADLDQAVTGFTQILEKTSGIDIRRRQTCRGPHLDDIEISIDTRLAKSFASQGQARTVVLALRLAEVDQLSQIRGEGPLLLADDLIAELDDNRAAALLQTLQKAGTCVIATGTRLPATLSADDPGVSVIHVKQGVLTQVGR